VPSGCEVSTNVDIFRAGQPELPGTDPLRYDGNLRLQDKQASPVSVRAVPWADEAEQQLYRLSPTGCYLSADVKHFRNTHSGRRAAGGAGHEPSNLRWSFEVARQSSSPSLCASVRAVPWAVEGE